MPYLSDEVLFVLMVAIAVFLITQSLIVPTFGENRLAKKRLKKRLKTMRESFQQPEVTSLLRDKYLRQLSPLERLLENLPGMAGLSETLDQAGKTTPAYRFLLQCLLLGAVAGLTAWTFWQNPVLSVLAVGAGILLPYMNLTRERANRINEFEEQLPDALDIMTRALRAGHPFTGTIQLVADEMEGPVAKEFGIVFSDINYGGDLRAGLLGMLARVPSVTVMALVTAVLIQRESGGNLAEILEKLTSLVRKRFRFQRQIRTYSAQGRMSAWVLVLLPFVLVALMSITSPDYLPMMTKDPTGRKLIGLGFFLIIAGILWIRKLIRIDI
jgi:tight adherence protein B